METTGQKVVSHSVSSYGATYGVNDIIGIAFADGQQSVTFTKIIVHKVLYGIQ